MNDEEQHCIDWIRSGHSFYANEFNMKDNNGRPMNIAEATFMQRLIIEAYKNGFRNNYFEADYTNIQKRDPHTDELTEEDQSYMVIDFYDFEKYKKDHPVTPVRKEHALNGLMMVTGSLPIRFINWMACSSCIQPAFWRPTGFIIRQLSDIKSAWLITRHTCNKKRP